jgi:Reverse transcriptase (RNA-dependent DNA polymerase)
LHRSFPDNNKKGPFKQRKLFLFKQDILPQKHDSFSDPKNILLPAHFYNLKSRNRFVHSNNQTFYLLNTLCRNSIQESYVLSDLRQPANNKKQKQIHLSPIVLGQLHTVSSGNSQPQILKILLDTGTSSTIIISKYTRNLVMRNQAPTTWMTKGGLFTTKSKCLVQFSLPEFYETRVIVWNMHVDESDGPNSYDMIIGRDLLEHLGFALDFGTMQIAWGTSTVPMRQYESVKENDSYIQYNEMIESPAVKNATTRLRQILDAKYEPADLDKITASCVNLTTNEQQSLGQLLHKYQHVFDGTLGQWKSTPYDIQLKDNVTPYHAKPFPIPKVHEHTLQVELSRLCSIGVLKKINRSEWAAPTFIIPKKDGTVRFISDFRELNKRIKRQPFPIPKIQDLLLKLEGFQYATSLDLNMGYYHIVLSPMSRRLCTIVTPYGKYEYQRLPMGLCNSPDIFQEKISHLMQGLEFV